MFPAAADAATAAGRADFFAAVLALAEVDFAADFAADRPDALPAALRAAFLGAVRDLFFAAVPEDALFAAELAELPAADLFAALFAALLDFAQRALCAAAILSRASTLSGRLPPRLLPWPVDAERDTAVPAPACSPTSICRTCCSKDISASNSLTICVVSMNPPPLSITQSVSPETNFVAQQARQSMHYPPFPCKRGVPICWEHASF